jgi:amino acid transporter
MGGLGQSAGAGSRWLARLKLELALKYGGSDFSRPARRCPTRTAAGCKEGLWLMATASSASKGGLSRTVGFVPVLFQSMTDTGPGYSVLLAIPFGAAFAAGSLPLAVILATVAMFLMAFVVGQLALRYPSAGGFYTYASRAFGGRLGFITGWGIVFCNVLIAALGPLAVAYAMVPLLQLAGINTPWILWVVLASIGGALLLYRGTHFSLRTGVILGSLELGLFAILAIIFIAKAGSANTLSAFSPSHAINGTSGLFLGMIWAIYAFIGFENALPMAEEVLEPRRAPQQAVVIATVVIGAFYLLTTYAGTVTTGFANMPSYTGDNWLSFADQVSPLAKVLVLFAIVNSAVAIFNSAGNAASRMLYAMGRAGVLPKALGTVNQTHRTPLTAILVVSGVVLVADIATGIWQGSPLGAVGWLGVPIVLIAIVATYMVACVAVVVVYSREFRQERNVLLHIVIPVLAFLIMLGPIYVAITSFNVYPYNLAVWLSVAWILIGAGIAATASKSRFSPEAMATLVQADLELPLPIGGA